MSLTITDAELKYPDGKTITATTLSYDSQHLRFEQDEKIIRASRDGAQIYVGQNDIGITHGSNGLGVSDGGTVIEGMLHITNYPSDIRLSSFWTFNDELLTCLPSTIYTPLPVLVYDDPPYAKHLAGVARMVQTIL